MFRSGSFYRNKMWKVCHPAVRQAFLFNVSFFPTKGKEREGLGDEKP
jgi:hypothetical protein